MGEFPQRSPNQLLAHGMTGGIVAGVVFAGAEMAMDAAMGKPFWGPLRMISSILLGTEALDPSSSFSAVIMTGLAVHILLAGALWHLSLAEAGTSMGRFCYTAFSTAALCGW